MDSEDRESIRPLELENGDTKTEFRSQNKSIGKSRLLIVVVLICFGSFGIGVLIGWFSHPSSPESHEQTSLFDTTSNLLSSLSRDEIKKHLRTLSSKPRLTGTPGEEEAVQYIANQMQKDGLSVEIKSYDVLLSFPDSSNPNKVQITEDGQITFTSQPFEKGLRPGVDNSKIVPPYNSYAPAGTVQGRVVYVNYGRLKDFTYVRDTLGIDVKGKIALARYGKIFRGDKLKIAAQFGAIGLILYTDPADFNADQARLIHVYPESWWMPPSGLQRGTVGGDGDYLTPFYPATEYAYRMNISDVNIPKIPCQPIGYGDASAILKLLEGPMAPADFQGGLDFIYNITQPDDSAAQVILEVNNKLEEKPVKNIIATIKGNIEPDRYVIMGNHHDAWAYGAVDPLSGSAAALEISRVFGQMLKEGWQPRRTIIICSWSGEEQGLLGSTEWVEDNMSILFERAVAYLNVDYTVDYTFSLAMGTSPLLQDPIFATTKKIPNPDPSSPKKTLYDIWRERDPVNKDDPNTEPNVYYSLGSGSDMATFYQRAGVSSVDMFYSYDQERWPILSYPLYHSAYETYYLFSSFIDPSFNYSLAMTQLWAVLACDIADSQILPFDSTRYSTAIEKFVEEKQQQYGEVWESNDVNIEALKSAAKKFSDAAKKFQNYISTIKSPSELTARRINDKLMKVERAFIDPEGLPGRRIYKHLVFAPSRYDAYSDESFPGIVDAMGDILQNKTNQWDSLKQQVSVATHAITMAAKMLADVDL